MANICVFCGSKSGHQPEFVAAARELGEYLAQNGHTLIYGGGSTGIMGVIADTVLSKEGPIVGVIPLHLARPELMHSSVSDMRITADMHERKALMHRLSDVYIALPGGFGTMEELFEAVTWAQLDLHAHPVAILNIAGLYDGMVHMIHAMKQEGFLSQKCLNLLSIFHSTSELIEWLDLKTSAISCSGG